MKIGIVCSEYFGNKVVDGKIIPTSVHGGFGFLTKLKAESLVSMGHEVHVFTYATSYDYEKKSSNEFIENKIHIHLIQQKVDVKSNIILTGLHAVFHKPRANEDFKNIVKANCIEILQFEDTTMSLMLSVLSDVPKLLIFQDPFDFYDVNLLIDSERNYFNILQGKSILYDIRKSDDSFPNEMVINWLHRKNFINPVRKLIEQSQFLKIYAESDFIGQKVQQMFDLKYTPETIRNPVTIVDQQKNKTGKPSFVWVGRWDTQKRPDMMLMCASELPEYDFYMIGTATRGPKDFTSVEKKLTEKFSKYSNVHILGFVDESTKREYIGRAWALINTSVREGLPITFLEAMAEATPIVSYVDPDNYVSRFGIKVDYTIESFKKGIEQSVREKLFERIGTAEREFIKEKHEIGVIMKKHLEIYNDILKG